MLLSLIPYILLLLLVAIVAFLSVWLRSVSANTSEIEKQKAEVDAQLAAAVTERDEIKARLGRIPNVEEEHAKLLANLTRLRSQGQQMLAALKEKKESAERELQDERNRVERELNELRGKTEGEANSLKFKINQLSSELSALDEEANLQSFGFYKPHYDFASSAAYQAKLDEIRAKQKKMISDKTAAVGDIEWTVNGSKTEGRKSINQTIKLLLRAFNGECDAAIAKVRYNNIHVMETRIRKAHEAITGLAKVQECRIVPEYLDLKMQELHLAHEYQEKVQAEKEEQRRIREQMREEEIALREIEKAKQDAEKEEQRYAAALVQARLEAQYAVGAKQQKMLDHIAELERRLNEAHSNKERAIARAQMTRSGHVYVISNIGSFGDNVYKIGMTRRLEPMDRVNELGDASVPFRFDVHAIIFAEDAPALEAKLHRTFHERRVNRINEKREFFHVTLEEIADVVRNEHGEIEFTHTPAAEEYRKTVALAQQLGHSVRPPGSTRSVAPVA